MGDSEMAQNKSVHPNEPEFAGLIDSSYQTSTPAWPDLPKGLHGANVITIVFDDMGFSHPSCFGSTLHTPNIDRLAAEGMKFVRAYSGSAVCAPSRCVLMTGQHTGHVLRRANQSKIGLLALPAGQMTVARLLHDAGYATGGFGKWGLGNPNTTGVAENQGFDVFFGYYDQKHAHDYYTDHLVKNGVDVPQPQSGKRTWEDYSHTRIADETLKFIEQNKLGKICIFNRKIDF